MDLFAGVELVPAYSLKFRISGNYMPEALMLRSFGILSSVGNFECQAEGARVVTQITLFDAWIVIVVCSTNVPPIFEYDLFGPSVAAALLLKPYLLLR
jgi:hypothetical protein